MVKVGNPTEILEKSKLANKDILEVELIKSLETWTMHNCLMPLG